MYKGNIMKQTIIFISPLASRSGYGDHAREIAEYLCEQDDKYESTFVVTSWGTNPMNALDNNESKTKELLDRIALEPTDSTYDICIHLGMPGEFKTLGRYNIGITAGVETNICPKDFLIGCNKMDLIIVPSEFTRHTLTTTTHDEIKCETEVVVVPETVDKIFYHENSVESKTLSTRLDIIKESFCFLFVGQWITSDTDDGGRKNIDSLIKTFIKTFHGLDDPPALVLKTNGTDFSYIDRQLILEKIKSITEGFVGTTAKTPSIYLIHGELTTAEMSAMYNHPKIKCNVSHTRGEGFGRPLLEASLSGRPVLASKWSGHLDFLSRKHSILLPGSTIKVGVVNGLFCKDAEWFNVNEKRASELMHEVYSNYDKYGKKAMQLADINLKKYSKDSIFDSYTDIFNTYMPPKSQEVELQLPPIEKIP